MLILVQLTHFSFLFFVSNITEILQDAEGEDDCTFPTSFYVEIIITTFAEVPGIIISCRVDAITLSLSFFFPLTLSVHQFKTRGLMWYPHCAVFGIDTIGRRLTQALEFLMCSVFIFILLIAVTIEEKTACLFGSRAMITGTFLTIFIFTPEMMPTVLRSTVKHTTR
jgi:hypothetical protein